MALKINAKKNLTGSSERWGVILMGRKELNISFLRIMIKSLRHSKTILESPSRRVKFHSKVGIGA